MNMIGYIGLGISVLAYLFLYYKKYKYFDLTNAIALFILAIYAVVLKNIPFILVNSFIGIILLITYFRENKK